MSNPRMYTAYVDGSSSGGWGPGGWGVVLVGSVTEREYDGCDVFTTNQRMEQMAAIQALEAAEPGSVVTIYSDAAYVINGMRERWYRRWEANDWWNRSGPIPNRDLWERLRDAERRHHEVIWIKVKGFKRSREQPEPLGEAQTKHYRADRIAVAAKERLKEAIAGG